MGAGGNSLAAVVRAQRAHRFSSVSVASSVCCRYSRRVLSSRSSCRLASEATVRGCLSVWVQGLSANVCAGPVGQWAAHA